MTSASAASVSTAGASVHEADTSAEYFANRLEALARQFSDAIPAGTKSMAELQGFLMLYRKRPQEAVANVATLLAVSASAANHAANEAHRRHKNDSGEGGGGGEEKEAGTGARRGDTSVSPAMPDYPLPLFRSLSDGARQPASGTALLRPMVAPPSGGRGAGASRGGRKVATGRGGNGGRAKAKAGSGGGGGGRGKRATGRSSGGTSGSGGAASSRGASKAKRPGTTDDSAANPFGSAPASAAERPKVEVPDTSPRTGTGRGTPASDKSAPGTQGWMLVRDK